MHNDQFATVDYILESYFDSFTSKTIDTIINSYSENNAYPRGYKDAAFFIYAANNKENFKEIIREFSDENFTGFEKLIILHEKSHGKVDEQDDLFQDCSRLLSENLKPLIKERMSEFFKEKVNNYLSEKLPEQYQNLVKDFDKEHAKIFELSSESNKSDELSEVSEEQEKIKVEQSKSLEEEFEENVTSENPSTVVQSFDSETLKKTAKENEILELNPWN